MSNTANYTDGKISELLSKIVPVENSAAANYESITGDPHNKIVLCSPFVQSYLRTTTTRTAFGQATPETTLTPAGPNALTQLNQFLDILKSQQQQGKTPSRVLIPMYVEGPSFADRHWTSLVLTPDPANPNKVDAVFVNSFGFKAGGYAAEEQAIMEAIQRVYPDSATTIKCTQDVFQDDNHSCGPITVTMLSKLATAQNPAQEVDGIIEKYGKQPAVLRQYHQDLLDNKNPDLEQMIPAVKLKPPIQPKEQNSTEPADKKNAVTFTKVISVAAGAFLVKKAIDFIWGKKNYNEETKKFERKTNWVGVLGGGLLLLATLVMGKKIVLDDKQPLEAVKDIAAFVTRSSSDKSKGFEKGS